MDGVFLLPTRNRIKNLRRFLLSAREIGTIEQGWVLVNAPELAERRSEYELAMTTGPKGWSLKAVDADSYGSALRAVWNDVKHMKWVGLVSDDLVVASPRWDTYLVEALQGWNFASTNDGWQNGENGMPLRMHGAIAWSGDLLRAVGWLFPPGFKHIFHDDVWESLGNETKCWAYQSQIMCRHLHESREGVIGPTMDRNSDLWKHDEACFKKWVAEDKPRCIEAIRALSVARGVTVMKPDFTGARVMIATPCIDGKYESSYMASVFQTLLMLQQNGVVAQLAEEKYTADISLGRAKLFGAFLRSSATHMLMIDADMAWQSEAILRLFGAKKDFVAIAGPKKRYPITFAANHTDKDGNPLPLQYDNASATMEVSEIGSAFCLITRRMAEKMRDSYPETEFLGATGEREYGVFMPLVKDRRYFSEDFAFCKRWRDIGGTVHMVPDVALSHTGSHTFTAAFLKMSQIQPMAQAAE